MTLKPRVYKATLLVMILFNTTYSVATIIQFTKGYPNILRCYLNIANYPCKIPRTSTIYDNTLGIFITKVVILPTALVTELAIAVYIATKSLPINSNISKAFIFILQAFIIWQLFVFIQITVGLMSIPLLVLTLISPAASMLSTGGILVIILMLIFLFANIPLPNLHKRKVQITASSFLTSCLITAETLLIAVTVTFTFASYYIIVKDGMDMSGTKGYIVSLLPSLIITTLAWLTKKQYFGKPTRNNSRKNLRGPKSDMIEHTDTDEEMITLSVQTKHKN